MPIDGQTIFLVLVFGQLLSSQPAKAEQNNSNSGDVSYFGNAGRSVEQSAGYRVDEFDSGVDKIPATTSFFLMR